MIYQNKGSNYRYVSTIADQFQSYHTYQNSIYHTILRTYLLASQQERKKASGKQAADTSSFVVNEISVTARWLYCPRFVISFFNCSQQERKRKRVGNRRTLLVPLWSTRFRLTARWLYCPRFVMSFFNCSLRSTANTGHAIVPQLSHEQQH
jgi:hypothetical protein